MRAVMVPTGKSPTLMSPPKPVLELADLAKSDFRDILSYTWQMWGDLQMDVYQDIIDQALRAIASDPKKGPETKRLELLVFACRKTSDFLPR